MIQNKDQSWTLEVVRKMYELRAIRIWENLKTMMKYSKIIFNDNIEKDQCLWNLILKLIMQTFPSQCDYYQNNF